MPIDSSSYLDSLVKQIGFEKSSFDNVLNYALTITLAAGGLSLTMLFREEYMVAVLVSGLALPVVLSLFFRGVRAYNNYYLYMVLKTKLVEAELLPQITDKAIRTLVERVDLRRKWEGEQIQALSKRGLVCRVLFHTEFLFLLAALPALEIASLYSGNVLQSTKGGYIVLIQLVMIALSIFATYPRK